MPRKKTKISQNLGLQEVLLNNRVDDDIQKLLFPMDLIQRLLLIPKYKIRDNFITPNGLWANIINIFFTCIVTMIFLYYTMYTKRIIDVADVEYVQTCLWLDFITYSMCVIINCLTCIFQSKNFVQLVLKIQESHRRLYSEKFQSFVKLNWVFFVILVIYQIKEAIIIQALYFRGNMIVTVMTQYLLSSIDFNILIAIRWMQFINLKFEVWLKEFRLYTNIKESSYGRLKTEQIWKRMYHMYSCITKCYNLFKKSFQYVIMYHVAEMFIHTACYVEMLIEFNKLASDRWTKTSHYLGVGVMMIWIVKKLTLHTLLAMALERFYMIQESVEDICSSVQARGAPDACKMMCKNIRRLNTSETDKFKPCLLFLMDAKFPLRLLSLITTYIIVLLQFAYL
ncbi:uncharacterized protein LOC119190396 [Manduca sexta]|uniref:uncharacterized protein LOC119190396 n=1 Tax=Manduca sexta TaxID=7130 RepID=UPI00188E5167|nr:uncharacterized protein LOC119190396 [Manduca sexta]